MLSTPDVCKIRHGSNVLQVFVQTTPLRVPKHGEPLHLQRIKIVIAYAKTHANGKRPKSIVLYSENNVPGDNSLFTYSVSISELARPDFAAGGATSAYQLW